MQGSLQAMEVALRVLAALTAKERANERDVAELREFAPDAASLPPDELACEVIQNVMRAQASSRAQGHG